MSLCLSVENIKKMKKYLIYMFALLLGSTLFTACSESDDEVDEYPNWRATNEAYFNSLYATAKQRVAAGDTQWKVLKSWSLGEKTTDLAEDHIVARVISEGTGTEHPLFTDSVRVHYRGRLLPSTSYAGGYVFDQTYYGDFNPATAMPVTATMPQSREMRALRTGQPLKLQANRMSGIARGMVTLDRTSWMG